MARTTKPVSEANPKAGKRRVSRPPGSKNKAKPAAKANPAPARRAAPAKRAPTTQLRRAAAAARAPLVTKVQLRAQVDKLERANATLRTKSWEARRAAMKAAARIEELEAELARLGKAETLEDSLARAKKGHRKTAIFKPKQADVEPKALPEGTENPERREVVTV